MTDHARKELPRARTALAIAGCVGGLMVAAAFGIVWKVIKTIREQEAFEV